MIIKVVRKASIDDVRRIISNLEKKYGGSYEEFENELSEGGVHSEWLEDSIEWSRMTHAIRAYGEGEDFDYSTEETVELDRNQVSNLTPRRIELLDQLSRLRVVSINDLASKVGRDVKNVHGDLKILEDLGFVRLTSQGRRIIPELLVHEITLLLG